MREHDLSRALSRVCLALEPDPADLAALGTTSDRWLLYRKMVRSRFWETITASLPRTREAVSAEGFSRAFAQFLAVAPPRSRRIRDVTQEFARFASRWWRDHPEGCPPWGVDLARYESARHAVASAPPAPSRAALSDFAVHLAPALTPARSLLRLNWDVHLPTRGSGHEAGTWSLLLYRAASDEVETLMLSETAADLAEAMAVGRKPVTTCVAELIALHGGGVDEAFLESVATLLSDLVERGVVLGSLPSSSEG